MLSFTSALLPVMMIQVAGTWAHVVEYHIRKKGMRKGRIRPFLGLGSLAKRAIWNNYMTLGRLMR